MDNHTVISEDGNWKISGIYFDSKNTSNVTQGSMKVMRKEDYTSLSFSITFQNKDKDEIKSIMLLTENPKIKESLLLKCTYSDIGELTGQMMISDENIIVIAESNDKEYAGSEYFKKISNDYYKNRGIIYKGNVKYSSWSYELRRIKDDTRDGGYL